MLVLACTATTTLTRGIGPGSAEFRSGYWPLVDNPRYATLARAVSLPGPGDAVAATYDLVPHLTHRRRIYRFPNPWWPAGWGVRGENTHDPETVDWMVLDTFVLGTEERGLLEHLIADREWSVRLDQDDVLVLQRDRP